MRPPARRAALSASAVSALTVPASGCIRCPDVSSAFTGRNVPAPTCSVTLCMAMPRCASASVSAVGEMQPRGRRRDRSFVVREHGLIVGVVLRVGRTPRGDVGRQRHVAALLDRLVEHRAVEREGERDLAAVALLLDGGVELAEEADLALLAEPHDVAGREPLCRLHEGAPARAVETAMQCRFDGGLGAAADAPAFQPRRDHLGVVDDDARRRRAAAPAGRAPSDRRVPVPPYRAARPGDAPHRAERPVATQSGLAGGRNRTGRCASTTVIAHNRGR